MLANATDFLMMLACTGFVVLTANLISRGFEALWDHVAPAPAAEAVGEPILDEHHLLPPGRGDDWEYRW